MLLALLFVAAGAKPIEGCSQLSRQVRLVDASITGDATSAKKALDDGALATCWSPVQGDTPLGIAAFRGHLDVAKVLIERGAVIDARGRTNNTPLCWLLQGTTKDKKPLFALLRDKGADTGTRCANNRTLVALAAGTGTLEDLALVLGTGPDANAGDSGATPFELALTQADDAQIVKRLDMLAGAGAAAPADPAKAQALLTRAIERCQRATFLRLGKAGLHFARGASGLQRLLLVAAGCGDGNAFAALLEAGAVVKDEKKETALYVSEALDYRVRFGKQADAAAATKLIAQLISLGADTHSLPIDSTGRTPLMLAAATGHRPLYDVIAAAPEPRFTDVDRDGRTVAWHAAWAGNTEILSALSSKIDLAKATTPALLPLTAAVDGGQADAAEWLLANTKYAPEVLGGIAATSLKKVTCQQQKSPVLDAIVRLVQFGAHPRPLRSQLLCHPDADRAVVAAAEKRLAVGEAPVPMQMFIWGDATSADEFAGIAKTLSPWIRTSAGFPQKLRSDDVPGLKPGFDVLAVAACPSEEMGPALRAWKAINPSAYVRDVQWPANKRACPWVIGGGLPGQISGNNAGVAISVWMGDTLTFAFAARTPAGFGLTPVAAECLGAVPEVAFHPSPRVILHCRGANDDVRILDQTTKPMQFRRP